MGGLDDPDAHAFVAARINIAGILDRHFGVSGVKRPDVAMAQPVLTANENLEQGPFIGARLAVVDRLGAGVGFCFWAAHLAYSAASFAARFFAACAIKPSRTHAPSSHALLRAASRSVLQGPLPLSTSKNSSQSGWVKS